MTQQTDSAIHRHADGSIDTGYYLARGRAARSRQAHGLFSTLARLVRSAWSSPSRQPRLSGASRA
jgi:hypothetical protein